MGYSRREFLQRSGQVLAAAGAARHAGTAAASDTLVVGLIGCRGMGFFDLENHLKQPGVACGGLCDVDGRVLESRAADVERLTGQRPRLYRDFRRMLENPALDAVIIATPDHWHCLQAVYACEAGKDVYLEKPQANSVIESALIARAARKHRRVVQVGQQQRSGQHWQDVVDFVRSGELGLIRQVKVWANFDYAKGAERVPDEPAPPEVDYDLWLGPAPERPFNPGRFHGTWRFQWDYGGGLLTDWGVHLLDIPLWALEVEGAPRSVSAIGGIFAYPDRQIEAADTQAVLYEFDDFNLIWEHTAGIQSGPYDRNYGIAFVGSSGTLVVNRSGWEIFPEVEEGRYLMEALPLQRGSESNHEAHARNFIGCIKSREEPACPVEAGHLAAFYAHLGNLAYRTGSRLVWDAEAQRFAGNEAADAFLAPEYRDPWTLPRL